MSLAEHDRHASQFLAKPSRRSFDDAVHAAQHQSKAISIPHRLAKMSWARSDSNRCFIHSRFA